MERCFELARLGAGHVSPNPLVGAVIVHNNIIIGEGFHREAGQPHAEVHAIHSVTEKELLSESTLYVNLEPCVHQGKTPPCAPLVIQNNIKKVVISNFDPFEKVNGQGIEVLKNNGIEVITGFKEKEGYEINKRFFTFHTKKRPYIILKWAQSQDGYMDTYRQTPEEGPAKITNEEMDIISHQWRSEESAILVGARTVIMDNPNLTVRHVNGKNPVRIVIDPDELVNGPYRVLNDEAPTILIRNGKSKNNLEYIAPESSNPLDQVFKIAYEKGLNSILVEGGSFTHQQLIQSGMWDEIRVITHTGLIFREGIPAPKIPDSKLTETYRIGAQIIQFFRKSE